MEIGSTAPVKLVTSERANGFYLKAVDVFGEKWNTGLEPPRFEPPINGTARYVSEEAIEIALVDGSVVTAGRIGCA